LYQGGKKLEFTGRKYFRFFLSIFAALLSGILLFAAFPSYDFHITAWVALVPLFLVLINSRPFSGFFISVVFGVVFYTGLFFWMFDLPKYRILHHTILGVYLTPLMGLFGLAFCVIARRLGIAAALLSVPFIWVCQEYIRSNLSFLSLPWGLLAHSQYRHPALIQIADLAGVPGISFMIVTVNSAVTAAIYFLLNRLKTVQKFENRAFSRQAAAVIIGAGAFLFLVSWLYGRIILSQPLEGQQVKIAVVQGNIPQSKKWDRRYATTIMSTYTELSAEASQHKPDLILWPETATPASIGEDYGIYLQVKQIAQNAKAPLLLGSSERQKISEKEPSTTSSERKYLNSAFLVRSKRVKEKIQRYDKIRLLPFGEYMPLKEKISWSYFRIPQVKGFVAGKDYKIFELPGFRFGVTICWENIFPDIVRHFVKSGAQFIVNITNEAWFGKTAAPYQFLSMSVFRAIENRVFVVRCTNTGISCFIDPCGRVLDVVTDKNGKDIFISGVLSQSVMLQSSKTAYTRYGDFFAWFCLIFAPLILLRAAFRKGG
jgi:apolipoprotein N-acyltransferase